MEQHEQNGQRRGVSEAHAAETRFLSGPSRLRSAAPENDMDANAAPNDVRLRYFSRHCRRHGFSGVVCRC